MSCYEWEAGTITIPTRAWVPLKKTLREAHNKHRDEVLAKAESLQAKLAVNFKGKRGVSSDEIYNYLHDQMTPSPRRTSLYSIQYTTAPQESFIDSVIGLTKASMVEGSASRTKKITQAMLDTHFAPKATNKTLSYEGDEWLITLNDEKRTVRWEVYENNRSVERARSTPMGALLFRELSRIDYGKLKTMGGVIVGNNEYNGDDDSVGGGGNYVTESFGKAGELARGW